MKTYEALLIFLNALKDDAVALSQNLRENGESMAREYYGQVATAGKTGAQKLGSRMQEKPTQTLLLAFLAGAAATYLLRSNN